MKHKRKPAARHRLAPHDALMALASDPAAAHSELLNLAVMLPANAIWHWMALASNPNCPPDLLLSLPEKHGKSSPRRSEASCWRMALAWCVAENPVVSVLSMEDLFLPAKVEAIVQHARMVYATRTLQLRHWKLICAELAEEWVVWLRANIPGNGVACMEITERIKWLRGQKRRHISSHPGDLPGHYGPPNLIPNSYEHGAVIRALNAAFEASLKPGIISLAEAIGHFVRAKINAGDNVSQERLDQIQMEVHRRIAEIAEGMNHVTSRRADIRKTDHEPDADRTP